MKAGTGGAFSLRAHGENASILALRFRVCIRFGVKIAFLEGQGDLVFRA